MIVFLLYAVVCFSLTVGRPRPDPIMQIFDVGELFSELPKYENPDIIMLKLATLGLLPILKITKEENFFSDEANKYDAKLVKKGLDDIVSQLQDARSKLERGDTNIIDGIEKVFENFKELKSYLQEDGTFGNSNSNTSAAPSSIDSTEPEAAGELLQYFKPIPMNDEATENLVFAAKSSDSSEPEADCEIVLQSSEQNSTNDEATENLGSAVQYSIDSPEPSAIDEILHIFTQTQKKVETSDKLKSENTNPKEEIHLIKSKDGGAKKFFEDIEYALFNKKKINKNPLGEAQNEI